MWAHWNHSFHVRLNCLGPVFSSVLTSRSCPVSRYSVYFLGSLGAQKFTFGGSELLMIMTSLFTDMAGNTLSSQWYKEGWVPKNCCFQIVVLEKTLESPLDSKEIKPVNPKGNQSWVLIGRIDAEAETAILWPPDAKNWLIGKDPVAGKDWRQKEKGTTKDEMVGWHHQLDGLEFEQALGVGNGRGSLACCSPWGRKELDTTE